MNSKAISIVVACLALSGCWNGENVSVSLGDVSVGQQLLDLKEAYEGDALTKEEYEATKQTLLALNNVCQNTKSEKSEKSGKSARKEQREAEAEGEEDDGFDWF